MIGKVSLRIVTILVSALCIALFTYQYLNSLQEKATVIVAAKDITARDVITEEHLKVIEVEANAAAALGEGAIGSPSELVGGIALRKIQKGEIMRLDQETFIFPENQQLYMQANGTVDLSAFVPKEKRLITIALPPHSAVDNRLKKGDWVDVIFTGENEDENYYSDMFLQQIEVFAVERLAKLDEMGKESVIQHVTVLASAQEAVSIALAKQTGAIDLVLNPWNGEREETQRVTLTP
ncbi:Flp pilus assembly protein CpaB [bacterium LRH843]|nr:Flp pilus assembly protein CpaB [bacterium LRH843]